MRDEIKDNPGLVVVLLVTGIVAAVIFCIYLLAIVWFPTKDSTIINNGSINNINLKLGEYSRTYINENTVIENYCKQILNIFSGGDMNLIKNIILPEYLSFRGINDSQLEATLKQKGILGKMLQFSSYSVVTHPKYGKIFEVNIRSYDNSYSDKMLVIQKSPNDYKVSFDGFIGLDKDARSIVNSGLKLDINEIKEQVTLISMKFTLTNISGHNIIINRENNYENIYIELTSGAEVRINSNWLAGETKELTNGYVVNLNTEFITTGLNNGVIKKMTLKNVYDTISRETKDLEFQIN